MQHPRGEGQILYKVVEHVSGISKKREKGSKLRLTVGRGFNELFNLKTNAPIPSHFILHCINATADCTIFGDSQKLRLRPLRYHRSDAS